MKAFSPLKSIRHGLSSRFHLALGLTSLVVSMLLLAQFAGLIPDRDAALREGRVSMAETVAVTSMTLLDDEDAPRLRQILGFLAQRHPELLAITLRRQDGTPHLSVGEVPAGVQAPAGPIVSTETLLLLPLQHGGQPWGRLEMHFRPLHAHWLGASWVPLLLAACGLCFVSFYVYLRRMLRHLDPSKVIPGRVRTAFDTLADGVLVLDPEGRIVLANRAFGDVLGQPPAQLIGRPAAELGWVSGDGAGAPVERVFTAVESQRNVLMRLSDAGGRLRTFMVNGSPVPGGDGRSAGLLVSLDDVTELEEKEIQLRLARDEAEAANRAKSEFLANMSHEIRTPMNAILGFAELLRRGWQHSPQDTQRHLDIILGSGRHLLALINDILDLSKVEAGRLEVERVPCAVHELVHEVAEIMRLRAEEKGVGLAVSCTGRLPARILTDPARVRQIVTNLVGNALKFTPQGRVTVRLGLTVPGEGEPGGRLSIEVIDTGIGIAADKLDAIFEPFVQAEASTTRQFGGTGLGLAISRRFARALGGDVTVRSEPGRGSTFRVLLDTGPLDGVAWLDARQVEAGAIRSPAAVPAGETTWRFDHGRVLVVDDGAENRELVRVVLEATGLRVSEARHGAEALDRVAAEPPDLILMDMQMPVMDGATATRRLRERGLTLPILALTANAMKGYEQEIEAAGFSGHLTKPVDIDALLAELASRLGGRRQAVPAAAVRLAAGPAPLPAAIGGGPVVSRLAGHARLARVVRTFGQTLPGKVQGMHEALAAGQLADLAELAHWLKGAGGTVGFDAFFEPARDLERHAREGRPADAASCLQVIASLATRLEIPAEVTSAGAPSVPRPVLGMPS